MSSDNPDVRAVNTLTSRTSKSDKNTDTLLKAENLSCQRGESVLFESLGLSVARSECLHVVGPNGSGKSSLLRILCGISQSETGQIYWQGEKRGASVTFSQSLAYIGHKDGLKNELSAIENLRFYQRLDEQRDEDQLDQSLATMKILKCADILTQGLSFGQRRRLAFAKLLVCNKPLWILDEPFTGIDVQGRELMQMICVNHLTAGGAIILTHHQSLDGDALEPFRTVFDLTQFKPALGSVA